jgi:hypothetical protein
MQDARSKIQDPGCRVQDAGCKMQDPGIVLVLVIVHVIGISNYGIVAELFNSRSPQHPGYRRSSPTSVASDLHLLSGWD